MVSFSLRSSVKPLNDLTTHLSSCLLFVVEQRWRASVNHLTPWARESILSSCLTALFPAHPADLVSKHILESIFSCLIFITFIIPRNDGRINNKLCWLKTGSRLSIIRCSLRTLALVSSMSMLFLSSDNVF